jgi:hypothetical protein
MLARRDVPTRAPRDLPAPASRRRAGRRAAALLLACMLLGLAACTRAGAGRQPSARAGRATTPGPAAHATAPGATPGAAPGAAPATGSPAAPAGGPQPARFRGTVSALPPGLAAQMRGTTWQPGCPVPLGRLRLLSLGYWGFDGRPHQGPMVVNATAADGVVAVFRRLFAARFPIQTLHLAVPYRPGQDDPNDQRNYTDGFNCRPVVTAHGPLGAWSQHAYGLAVDINPIQNPYVASDGYVRNLHARPYRDRALDRPGMIHPGDVVVRAFAAIGWRWGGSWSGDKDYMHFSATGR